jgi:uncharacterized membrane protein YdjX (TVP38/TMEM64 family)
MDFVGIALASMAVAAAGADMVTVYIGGNHGSTPPHNKGIGVPGSPSIESEKGHPSFRQAARGVSAATASNPPLSRAARIRNRVLAAFVALLVVSCVYWEVHVAAIDLYRVIAHSPKGSLTSPAKLVDLASDIRKVAEGQLVAVTLLIVVIYITLQTFCIPGTVGLNVVTGALLGLGTALPLCVVLGTIGATCCYALSSVAGLRLATAVDQKLMQGQGINKLRTSVARYRSDLFAYLLFLRLTPILPNWLINLGSPVASVPLGHFALATFLGITPQTYLSVRFGTVAQSGSIKTIVTWYDTAAVAGIGCVVLLATRLKKRFTHAQVH